jgi:hypothetical protein
MLEANGLKWPLPPFTGCRIEDFCRRIILSLDPVQSTWRQDAADVMLPRFRRGTTGVRSLLSDVGACKFRHDADVLLTMDLDGCRRGPKGGTPLELGPWDDRSETRPASLRQERCDSDVYGGVVDSADAPPVMHKLGRPRRLSRAESWVATSESGTVLSRLTPFLGASSASLGVDGGGERDRLGRLGAASEEMLSERIKPAF